MWSASPTSLFCSTRLNPSSNSDWRSSLRSYGISLGKKSMNLTMKSRHSKSYFGRSWRNLTLLHTWRSIRTKFKSKQSFVRIREEIVSVNQAISYTMVHLIKWIGQNKLMFILMFKKSLITVSLKANKVSSSVTTLCSEETLSRLFPSSASAIRILIQMLVISWLNNQSQ